MNNLNLKKELVVAIDNIKAVINEYYHPENNLKDKKDLANRVGTMTCNPFFQNLQFDNISTRELIEYLETLFVALPNDPVLIEEVTRQTFCAATAKFFDSEMLDYWFKKIPQETANSLGYLLLEYTCAESKIEKTGDFFREYLKKQIEFRNRILLYLRDDENKSKMVAEEYRKEMQKTAAEILRDDIQNLSMNYTDMITATHNNEPFSQIVRQGMRFVLSAFEENLNIIEK